MYYPGDSYTFTLFITTSTGVTPSVTANPMIQIINAATGTSVLGTAGAMTLIPSTTCVYKYTWVISSSATAGEYVAVASYAANGNTFSGYPFETVSIGDSRITGIVALNNTVALNATVAKDATVAHFSDLANINPTSNPTVMAIKAKTDLIPAIPAAQSDVLSVQTVVDYIESIVAADMSIDKTTNPVVMTLTYEGNTIAIYNIVDDSTTSGRIQT